MSLADAFLSISVLVKTGKCAQSPSQLWLTPTSKSPAPKAAIISVALGSKETTRGPSVSGMGTCLLLCLFCF
jgi:hypothetical protein